MSKFDIMLGNKPQPIPEIEPIVLDRIDLSGKEIHFHGPVTILNSNITGTISFHAEGNLVQSCNIKNEVVDIHRVHQDAMNQYQQQLQSQNAIQSQYERNWGLAAGQAQALEQRYRQETMQRQASQYSQGTFGQMNRRQS